MPKKSEKQRALTFRIRGRLDTQTTGARWQKACKALERMAPSHLIVDASQLDYCDLSGIGLLVELRRRQQERGGEIEIQGLREEFQQLLALVEPQELATLQQEKAGPSTLPEAVGQTTVNIWEETRALITFVGEMVVALLTALLHPRQIRWQDAFLAAEKAGVNALPIVALLGFLIGLIIAFQSAISVRQFGAEIFIAGLIGLSMLRELGPLITAIILAGRSGSAFAAELGTMKVNEEIDALTTMGLDPVRFLVVTRVIAAVCMTPLLTVFANLFGLIGGAVVFRSIGFPLVTYYNNLVYYVTFSDFLGGLAKSFVFGIVIAGIGCLRGLQTQTGASAVGDSATRAVVSGIILITVIDGIFAVIYYYLDI
jgi:phospholipid/cholesterol/gamma-HCH transport system permease protein